MVVSIFEKSQPGQKAYSLPKNAKEFAFFMPPAHFLRKTALDLPDISELDLTRHFANLAQKNFGVDVVFYPLGSCTMKYNPRANEKGASFREFTSSHPLTPSQFVQGNLELMDDFINKLAHLCGMDGGTLAPNAGAQGEFVGLQMILAYHAKNGEKERNEVLIPDSAHGTNPATSAMSGMKTIPLKTGPDGDIDLNELNAKLSSKTAALMLTNPSTLGLFSTKILQIKEMVHQAGGLLYYDGANLNPLLEVIRPGDMGFDVMHINLHKTFSTPHGGGGPGGGPVLCKSHLIPYLPLPRIEKIRGKYVWKDNPSSIGHISSFHGNFAILVRAYLYFILHGYYGLRKIAEMATLNANYLKHHISSFLTVPYERPCMHEFVVQADRFLNKGVTALDIAKRLIDFRIHPPTIYFPQIVKEALLIEPTETESKATLDHFIEVMKVICREIEEDPATIKLAPLTTEISRLDEAMAARCPCLTG